MDAETFPNYSFFWSFGKYTLVFAFVAVFWAQYVGFNIFARAGNVLSTVAYFQNSGGLDPISLYHAIL